LFRVFDPRTVLAIGLLCVEPLQEAETRRSGRVPRSAVLGHAETLLAAMRHLITNARLSRAPGASPKPSFMRFAESTIESTIKEKGNLDRW
jgi:hypothetical protein